MRLILFSASTPFKTVDLYNQWAYKKALHKDVIIHTHIVSSPTVGEQTIAICVFYDEQMHPEWMGKDDTEV